MIVVEIHHLTIVRPDERLAKGRWQIELAEGTPQLESAKWRTKLLVVRAQHIPVDTVYPGLKVGLENACFPKAMRDSRF